jgi:hypothetical protein
LQLQAVAHRKLGQTQHANVETGHAPSLPPLEQCGNEPNEQTFYLARAQYRQGNKKEEDLLRAEQIEKSWRAGMALVQYYQDAKQYDKMFDKAKEYVALYPAKDALGLKYATAMLLQKKYRECTEFLSQLNVLPYEGSNEGRRIYREAWLLCALQNMKSGDYAAALSDVEKSKLWTENLGVGKPYDEDIDLRAENYLTARCYEKLNDKAQATVYYSKVKQQDERFGAAPKDEIYEKIIEIYLR